MATKKSATKKAASTDAVTEKNPAKKTAAKKIAAKKTAAAPPSAEQPKAAAKAKPTHHDIELRAYLLWERDGKKHGQHDSHWHQAEKELHS